MTSPLIKYRAFLAEGALGPDMAQAMAVEKLEGLHKALATYKPADGEAGWLARFGFSSRSQRRLAWTPGDCESNEFKQGLYIYGEVGRGKSMLMDLFFSSSTVKAKRRVHFHEFMRDLHDRIHLWRQDGGRREKDPIPELARHVAGQAWLLCFDELQVTDIADAMILGRLFQELMALGVVMVITSNRAPDDLYKDGLQRDRFLPFIAIIKQQFDLLELNSERDYRLGRKKGMQVYYAPSGDGAEAALGACFHRLTGGLPAKEDLVCVHERCWTVPKSADGVAWFDFDQLCRSNLGASDYLQLATLYHTVILSSVPILSPANRDAARRFVTLIDALYEHKVTFLCSAAAAPEQLYPAGDGSFEFRRTASRLMEMQAEDYLLRTHLT
ncbi:MAG TPA: cell division protein ZapE [Rhodospirillaceae bacterium]|nr:cell division protein ZapE [Rhodospirillaceae bacterium]